MPITIKAPGVQTIEVEDGVSFDVRNEEYADLYRAIQFNQAEGLSGDPGAMAGMHYMLMRRVVAWTGIMSREGSQAECTEENKLTLFGARPDLLRVIADKINEIEDTDRKN